MRVGVEVGRLGVVVTVWIVTSWERFNGLRVVVDMIDEDIRERGRWRC
jgi:hypothetical protein